MIHLILFLGIIGAEGSLWRDQRKLATDILRKLGMVKFGATRKQLEAQISRKVGECLTDIITRHEDYKCIEPVSALHHSMGNTLNEIVFGVSFHRDDSMWKHLQYLQEEGVKFIGISGPVNFLPFLRYIPSQWKTLTFLLEGKKLTHEIYDKIIARCREILETYPDCVLKSYLIERKRRAVANEESFDYCSDEQLRHLLADLFGAGVDTTLTTIRWFLLFTGLDLNLQKALREEIKQVLGEPRKVSMDDYPKMHLMRAAISEAQRIRTVVPVGIPHGAAKDTEIQGFKVAKGTMILPLLWAVHMDEKAWEDPETFNPYRFLDNEGNYQNFPSFMPFQTGKKNFLVSFKA